MPENTPIHTGENKELPEPIIVIPLLGKTWHQMIPSEENISEWAKKLNLLKSDDERDYTSIIIHNGNKNSKQIVNIFSSDFEEAANQYSRLDPSYLDDNTETFLIKTVIRDHIVNNTDPLPITIKRLLQGHIKGSFLKWQLDITITQNQKNFPQKITPEIISRIVSKRYSAHTVSEGPFDITMLAEVYCIGSVKKLERQLFSKFLENSGII